MAKVFTEVDQWFAEKGYTLRTGSNEAFWSHELSNGLMLSLKADPLGNCSDGVYRTDFRFLVRIPSLSALEAKLDKNSMFRSPSPPEFGAAIAFARRSKVALIDAPFELEISGQGPRWEQILPTIEAALDHFETELLAHEDYRVSLDDPEAVVKWNYEKFYSRLLAAIHLQDDDSVRDMIDTMSTADIASQIRSCNYDPWTAEEEVTHTRETVTAFLKTRDKENTR